MAEHLHGYPRCETSAGASCNASEPHGEECKSHGVFRSCEASVVDGIPTGQYRCTHDEAPSASAKKAASRPKAKPRKATRARPKAKKKAARKAPKKKSGAKKAKKASKKRAAKKGGRKKK